MHNDKRKSGISLIGDLPWGSHLCQLYQTREDLRDILAPFLAAGRESNEMCLVVSSATTVEDDLRTLQECGEARLEVMPYPAWKSLKQTSGSAVIAMLDQSISKGFDGLRLAFHLAVEEKEESVPADEIDTISGHNVLAVFAYPRDRFDALGLMEMIKNHRFALVRNAVGWDVIESSEARIAKDMLKKSEEKLSSLFANMSEGFAYHRIVLDPDGAPCDFVYVEVNEAFERITGLRSEQVVGRKATEVFPGIENDPSDWIRIYGEVAMSRKPAHFESYVKSLGRWYSISAFSPHRGYFAVTFSDITDRKRAEDDVAKLNEELKSNITELSAANAALRDSRRAALNVMEDAIDAGRRAEETSAELRREVAERKRVEEALRESEERLKRAQGISHLGSWELDLASNSLTWSDEVYRIFGLQPQQFAASYEAFLEAVHPDDRAAVDEAYMASVRENRDSYEIEHRIVRKTNGEVRVVHEKCEHFRDASGRIIRSAGMVHDITERKQIENALRESEGKVRRKLDSILSPDGEVPDLELADLIDTPSMQSLMDNFYLLTKMPMGLIDLNGKVLVGVGWQDLCTRYHRVHPETCANCIESDSVLSAGIPEGEFKLYKCKNNIWDVATPVIVGGKHFGNFFMGQFFFDDEEIDYELFRAQARSYGFDETEYLAAVEKVPRLNREALAAGMAYFMELAAMISRMSYSNLKLARALSERDDLMKGLQKSTARLDLLADNAGQLLASDAPQQIVNELCRKIMTFLECDVFFNFLIDEDAGRLRLNAYAGIPEEEARQIEWLDLGVAVCGCAARDASRVAVENIGASSDSRTDLVKSYGVEAYAAHPLIAQGRVLGTLSFGTRTRTRFTDEELALMKGVADQVAVAIERKRIEEALRRAHDELERRVQERTEELAATVETLLGVITERERAEKNLQHLNRLYAVLSETNQAIVRAGDRHSLFNDFCRIAVEQGGFRLAWVGLVDRKEGGAVCKVAAFGETGYLDRIRISITDGPESLGPVGRAIRAGTCCVSNDFLNDQSTVPWQESAKTYGIRAAAAVPLREEEQIIGAVALYAGETGFFDDQHVELVKQVAADISFALDNFRREARRHEAEQALREETSERLRALEELRQKDQLLIQQSRQAAMGEMIGNIAHQWRQPLNNLGLVVQHLPLLLARNENRQDLLEKWSDEAMDIILHMSQTIDDFQSFFKPEQDRVVFGAREVMEKTFALIDGSFKHNGVRLLLDAPEELPVEGFPNQFSQVILNILNNARDALCTTNTPEPTVIVRLFRENGRTVVTISDNAGGIPEEIIGRIFEPYFTTKGLQGTGIGLYMSKNIIEKNMNGSLRATNGERGAEFRIEVNHDNGID